MPAGYRKSTSGGTQVAHIRSPSRWHHSHSPVRQFRWCNSSIPLQHVESSSSPRRHVASACPYRYAICTLTIRCPIPLWCLPDGEVARLSSTCRPDYGSLSAPSACTDNHNTQGHRQGYRGWFCRKPAGMHTFVDVLNGVTASSLDTLTPLIIYRWLLMGYKFVRLSTKVVIISLIALALRKISLIRHRTCKSVRVRHQMRGYCDTPVSLELHLRCLFAPSAASAGTLLKAERPARMFWKRRIAVEFFAALLKLVRATLMRFSVPSTGLGTPGSSGWLSGQDSFR